MRSAIAMLVCSLMLPSAPVQAGTVAWSGWSEEVFARAARENRFVLLYVEAVWCHWCHVMDHDTYGNADVQKILESRFITVRVDSDARPDLALRYKRYGWPATVIFSASGEELAKRKGYLEPREMIALLEAIVARPVAEKEDRPKDQVAPQGAPILPKEIREHLFAAHAKAQDARLGGLNSVQKLLDPDSVEFGILSQEKTAKRTVEASLALLDPVWGGVYQYSTHGDWKHPHYEKIMSSQAGALRIYTLAWMAWKDARALAAARSIVRYLRTFLKDSSGAFWTSQDADVVPGEHADKYFALNDRARRKKGMPKIDRHVYARENGWIIEALAEFGGATKDTAALEDAIDAARAIAKLRSLEDGGFRHDAEDPGGPYLGDTLAMGRAFLALYEAGQDRDHLALAMRAADFIGKHFAGGGLGLGFPSSERSLNAHLSPTADLDENIAAARFFNRLSRYSGRPADRALAEQAMRYLAAPAVTEAVFTEPGILLADREMTSDPLHITIVGAKKDTAARALFEASLQIPASYRRIEWWDPAEGPLVNADVTYPQLKKAAAFLCTRNACSTPILDPKAVARAAKGL